MIRLEERDRFSENFVILRGRATGNGHSKRLLRDDTLSYPSSTPSQEPERWVSYQSRGADLRSKHIETNTFFIRVLNIGKSCEFARDG